MITGFVEKIVYQNKDNAYCVLEVSSKGDDYILVGTFPYVSEGDYIEAEGDMVLHPVYGEQMQVRSFSVKAPEGLAAIAKYLSSGAIKGVGQGLAKRILAKFGEDTIRILEEEPERLAEIKGISVRMAMEISAQVEEKRDMREAMMFLAKYGISMNLALKLYRHYGQAIYSIIEENPYRLADDVTGIGFKIADDIARRTGFAGDSEFRIKAGILYTLNIAQSNGHMYLPKGELIGEAEDLLELTLDKEFIDAVITNLEFEKKVVNKDDCIFTAQAYFTELKTAQMLLDINDRVPVQIITGGPGTGKTTNIKKIIAEYEALGLEVACAAPTGRAAKRMEQATGHPASTIHRLLEVQGIDENTNFGRDESCPLEYDVVIIDEMSMVDSYLMHALLKAIARGTKLVLVGDTNQLPSVGPGNVLKDIIASNLFETMRLNRIYRQDEQSDIILNAHKMINDEPIDVNKPSKDFVFVKRAEPEQIIAATLTLVKEKLPNYVNACIEDIQVMSPMKKGALGVERLNTILQQALNPPSREKGEREIAGTVWREGDKVMQIKNNYDKNVFNGDIGIIREVNDFAETLDIEFDDERVVEYSFNETEELELAYAITIHKSQGSEYPAVVIPVHQGPKMLMTRNLIYTAVTRAQKCATLVGVPERFLEMVENTHELQRYSGLAARLNELSENTL